MDRGAWRATVHGVAKSQTQMYDRHTHTHTCIKANKPLFTYCDGVSKGLNGQKGQLPGAPSQRTVQAGMLTDGEAAAESWTREPGRRR